MSQHASPSTTSTTPQPSSDPVYHLAYVSTETEPFSQIDLVELLAVARGANAERGVTGLLLYREGCFYQVLEGNEFAVKKTFNDIEQDRRHRDVQILFKGESESREFPDWQMGFLNLDGMEVDALSGFSDFLSRDAQPREFLENLSRGKRLALMFRTLN
jgi:hypothetical protein